MSSDHGVRACRSWKFGRYARSSAWLSVNGDSKWHERDKRKGADGSPLHCALAHGRLKLAGMLGREAAASLAWLRAPMSGVAAPLCSARPLSAVCNHSLRARYNDV